MSERIRCVLAEEPFDAAHMLAEFTRTAVGAGAVVSFTGIARETAKSGEPVRGLQLDHHARLTLRSLEVIAKAAQGRFTIDALLIVHRCGWVEAGDPIVLVAAASAHRRAALQAVDYAMDRLKTEAVFWKREDGPKGANWIEPTPADYRERERWDDAADPPA